MQYTAIERYSSPTAEGSRARSETKTAAQKKKEAFTAIPRGVGGEAC